MSILEDIIKKKGSSLEIQTGSGSTLERITRKEAPVIIPKKEPISFFDRIKRFGTGAAKFVVETGVLSANIVARTFDFTADFLSSQVGKQIKKPIIGISGITKPTQQQKNLATKWKNFYATTGGEVTEKMKSFTQDLTEIDFIQPSEKWQKLSTKEKFSPKNLPETVVILGPSVVSSLGLYALSIPVGMITTVGSTADEIKTIAMEEGVPEEKAENLGLGTGLFVVALDKIVPSKLFSKEQKKAFIGGFVKRVVKAGLLETVTEIAQENIQLFVESTLRDDLKLDEVVLRNAMAGLGGLMGGVGAQTTVSFVNGVRSGDIAGLEEDFDKPVEVVKKPEVEKVVSKVSVKPREKVEVKKKVKEPVIIRKPILKEVTEKQIKTTKNLKDTKSTLRNIRQELSEAVTEAEGLATVAQEKRAGVNVEDINKLKRIYALNKKFQEGDIETIRASRTGGLLNRVVENVQEVYPQMGEQEAFDFALALPTKAQESVRTPVIRELEKKEKKLSKFLALLKTKQGELKIQEDDELSKEWARALAVQEKLIEIVKVPKRQLPVGEGKEKVSRLQARLKGALDVASKEDIEELGLTTFRQMNQEEQIAKASEYVTNNTEEALKVVRGEIDPPEGILQNSVFAALVELGKVDTDVATQVATLTATRFGQEINILKKILADNPVVMMQDIVNVRIEAYEKRTGRMAKQRIKTEVEKIGRETKAPDIKSWDSFLDSIKC